MPNPSEQTKVPLSGRGLTYRVDGDYRAGEYSRFTNVEIVNGIIRTRRPIQPLVKIAASYATPLEDTEAGLSYHGAYTFGGKHKYFQKFVGENVAYAYAVELDKGTVLGHKRSGADHWPVYTIPNNTYPAGMVLDNSDQKLILSSPSGNFVEGYFNYAGIDYWLVRRFEFNVVHRLLLYHNEGPWQFGPDATFDPAFPSPVALGGGATDGPLSKSIMDADYELYHNQFDVKKTFVYKDRVWILTYNRLYFSKATDPREWAAPDGGFIGLESGYFTDAEVFNDTIYISTTTKTYAYTYTSDPNEDGLLRPIFNEDRIDSLCVCENELYAANSRNMYMVGNNSLKQVVDFTTTFKIIDDFSQVKKIVAFGDSIIILRGRIFTPGGHRVRLAEAAGMDRGGTFMYNTTNGSMSQIELHDYYPPEDGYAIDSVDALKLPRIVDVAVPPSDNAGLAAYFAVREWTNANNTWIVRYYFMNYNRNVPESAPNYPEVEAGQQFPFSNSGLDTTWTINDVPVKTRIPIDVQMDNWSPDETEYLLKRFRAVLFEGDLPSDMATQLMLYYDDNPVGVVVGTDQIPPLGNNRDSPYPYRVKLNQKSKTLTTRFKSVNPLSVFGEPSTILADETDSIFYLSLVDMRTLWSYTGNVGNIH